MIDRELIMERLFARLTAPPLVFRFTADLQAGNTVVGNISDASQLLKAMPLSGNGIRAGTAWASLDPPTLSRAPDADGVSVSLTQGFKTAERRWPGLPNVTAGVKPAFYLVDGNELWPMKGGTAQLPRATPGWVKLEPYIWFHLLLPGATAIAGTAANALLGAIDKALEPPAGSNFQDLGLKGVLHCCKEGQTIRGFGSDGTLNPMIQLAIWVDEAIDTALKT